MQRLTFLRAAWILLFAISAFAAVSTSIPNIGLLFVLFLAHLWPIIFFNAGMIIFAADCLVGKMPKWALVLPVLWFGGYEIYVLWNNFKAARIFVSIEAFNTNKHVSWDREKQRVHIAHGPDDLRQSTDLRPVEMIENFDIFQVSESRQSGPINNDNIELTTLSAGECPRPGSGTGNGLIYSQVFRSRDIEQGDAIKGLCWYRGNEYNDIPKVIISTSHLIKLDHGNVMFQYIAINVPNQKRLMLKAGYAVKIPWFPMPIVGCHLNLNVSDEGDRQCDAGFAREGSWLTAQVSPLKVTADALGLKLASIGQRLAASPAAK